MPRQLPGFVDRAALRARVGAMLPATGPARAAAPQTAADPKPGTDEYQVINWLTRLHLLHGVPFAYLVPDVRMLPAESIRFFQLDNAWIEALIDGAFSIGTARGTDAGGAALRDGAGPMARARLGRIRAGLLEDAQPGRPRPDEAQAGGVPEVISGFLLRSSAVSGWPGLEVRGYADTAGTVSLPLLRLERISPSLLCCLLGGVLRRVDIQEPPEGVHFGLDPAPAQPDTWQKQLRYVNDGTVGRTGAWIPGAVQPAPLRPGPATVVRIDALAQAMAPRVWAQPAPRPALFTAAQFGLEMIEGVQSVSFQMGAGA